MSNPRYYTVVFEIHDEEAWKEHASKFTASLAGDGPVYPGIEVTACGEGDAMSQADALEEAVLEMGHDPDEIISEWAEANGLHPRSVLG